MQERSNREVLKEYVDSLHAMQYLGRVSALVDLEMKRIYGEVLGEIMKRDLLVEAAEVYSGVQGQIQMSTTYEDLRFPTHTI